MYEELKKYQTGNKVDKEFTSKVSFDEYAIPLGDLITDFIKHQTTPRRKRKSYYDHLTEIYIDTLNEIKIIRKM